MSETTPSPRRYSDEEVRALLERATELQTETPALSGEAAGLTLGELEDIAREAGIDPTALRQAAAELETGGHTEGGAAERLAGAPVRTVLEQTLPVALDPDNLEVALPLIQATAGTSGQGTQVGHTLTWQATAEGAMRRLQVMVTARDGETRIRIEERYGDLAGAVFGSGIGGIGAGVGFGVGVGVGASIGSVVMMVGFPVLALGLTYAGSRAVYTHIVRRRREVLDRLMADLAAELTAAGPPALPGPEAGASDP